jgi:RNA polymerase sigma-70 factor (ECF subfamily)
MKAERAEETTSNGELMRRTAAGDREAFAGLVDRHKDALVSYLARLTGCRDRSQDLAQETFLRLYQRADRYEDRGQFKAYLYRIATNLVRSEARREHRFRLLLPFLRHKDGQHPEAAHRVLRDEARQKLAEAVTRLPLGYRVPLVLHEIEGWPYHEIAEQLGCRVGTVKSRVHRARRRLKDQLAPYWHGHRTWRPAQDPTPGPTPSPAPSPTQELNGEMP